MTTTYKLSHPQLSEPIEIDDEAERTEHMIKRWAEMYIMRNYGVPVSHEDWTVEVVA